MMTDMQIPRPLYYFLISTLTQLALALTAMLVLLPTGLFGQLPWSMVGFLFAYNIIVATLLAVVLTDRSAENKPAAVKGGGLVLGHLVGLLVGGFVGSRLGGLLWAIGAAAMLYFVFGWLGGRISRYVAGVLERGPADAIGMRTSLRL